jgi:hypothetical protein
MSFFFFAVLTKDKLSTRPQTSQTTRGYDSGIVTGHG